MSSYEIVIETAGDLNTELRDKYHIYHDDIKCLVYLGEDKEILADNDFKSYSEEEFFKIVKKYAGKARTAFATYEEFAKVCEPILKAGKDIIIVTISTGVSGTYGGFKSHAEILLEDYPGRKIEIVDSLKYASAVGLLAIYAAKNRDEKGMSFEDNVKWLNENKLCLHEIGPMDDLRFLAKNGRIAAPKAFFGQLVGVQPVADFTYDGKSMPLGTIKGNKAVNDFCLKYLLENAKDLKDQVIIVNHSQRGERAKLFKEQLLKVAKPKEVIITHVGMSCGPNVGLGLCAYFFMGDKITPNREKENASFAKLTNK